MNKNKELIKNTFILLLGKFCTQFISFLLIPIYTFYLLSNDYGYIDLIQTYIMLIVPIIILRLDSGIFRYLIDARNNESEQSNIIFSCFAFFIFQVLIFLFIFFIAYRIIEIKYSLLIIITSISLAFSSILLQVVRGIGKNIEYSIGSIITGITTLILNIVLIIKFNFDGRSILISSIIGNILCSLYLIFKINLFKYMHLRYFNSSKLKEIMKYSVPMIPDGLSWWVINVSDRTIISFLINTAANGIYAVSSKFSNILSSIFQIFNMSWQESASLHINDNDRDEFFTEVLNKTYMLFYSICILILVCMPFIFYLFIGKEYLSAYYYIPILLLGNLFNALANIIGGVYIAKKETKKVARTTIMAAFINIVINLILIKKFELYAAAISTLISYIIVALYRYIDVKKYVKMKMDYKNFATTIIIFLISGSIYYVNNFIFNVINLLVILFIIAIFNKHYIHMIFNKIRRVK